jgi:Ca2+-binding RTX toxin-like protein
MLGVTGATGSYGVYDLNQGVYTVMSYNEAWDKHPDGPTTQAANGSIGQVIDHGWSLFGAFDVAVLKERYGLADQHVGNTTYTLNDDYHTAYYNTIVDTDGTDTIAYGGALDAQIDLQAATLDYSPTGGGAISFLHNVPGTAWQQQVKGGFTIANGVVIENATGGSGNDLLIGNSANNVLTGNAGNDTLAGRTGIDVYRTGAGADTVIVSLDSKTVETKKGLVAYDLVTDFDGVNDKLDFSDLDAKIGTAGVNDAFKWIGTNANKNAGDLSYKVVVSLNGAEKALGIEIDNYTGAHNGKVTVVMANVDGGAVDYMVVLLGAPTLTADDFSL